MAPLSVVACQTLLSQLIAGTNAGDNLTALISAANTSLNTSAPPISASGIVLSSAPPDFSDRNIELTYPRVCIFTNGLKNTQIEKFRAFSGTLSLIAEIWSSADLITQSDLWIHVYSSSVAQLLQTTIGDWGNGLFYAGAYDIQFAPPRVGGLGFVQSARLTINLGVSVG